MGPERDDDETPGIYLSPYELWNFGAGLDYALPGVRKCSRYISAFAELVPKDKPPDLSKSGVPGRLPTIWAAYKTPQFLPFVAENPDNQPLTVDRLKDILRAGLDGAVTIFNRSQNPGAGARSIKKGRFRIALPIPEDALHADLEKPDPHPQADPDPELRKRVEGKRLTIMAVIDDGIPFAHRNFREADGHRTRVEFCWLQSARIDPQQKSVLFGREYTRAQINDYIREFGDDEDRLYYKAGATSDADDFGSLLGHHTTHGAHVMNLATGYDPAHEEEPPEDIRIIAVQLPNSVTMDTSGFGKDMYILAAFHYIFNRVDIIKEMYNVPDPRLVISFSYGYTGGRHDGETELEAAIDELITLRRRECAPTALVLASGNTFLDRLHAQIDEDDFQGTEMVELPWRIQPNDRTPSYLELWFWADYSPPHPPFSVELRDPSGNPVELRASDGRRETSMQVGADPQEAPKPGDPVRSRSVLNRDGDVIGQISADSHRDDGGGGKKAAAKYVQRTGRWRVLVVLAPTEPEDDSLPGAAAGRWTVVIRRNPEAHAVDYPIRCWIQRATDFESFRSGSRQSYFDDSVYEATRFTPEGDFSEEDSEEEQFKTLIKRFGSLNGLATGKTALTVAGFRLGAGLRSSLACAHPARYSAAGPLEYTEINDKVDCSSMSDRSRVMPGTISSGVRSGSRSFLQGTSAAAPFVARRLAEVFAKENSVPSEPGDNYLSWLRYPPEAGEDLGCRKDDPELTKARLGEVLVRPYRQPGISDRI